MPYHVSTRHASDYESFYVPSHNIKAYIRDNFWSRDSKLDGMCDKV